VWAGQVSVTVEVTRTGSSPSTPFKIVLTAGAGYGDEPTQAFDGHLVKFSVSPYPQLGKTISPGDYRLRMTVTRFEAID